MECYFLSFIIPIDFKITSTLKSQSLLSIKAFEISWDDVGTVLILRKRRTVHSIAN